MTVHTHWRGEGLERVLVVTIDRPERRNAVDLPTLLDLQAAQQAAADGGARVLVLTGAPPAFCAGADLNGVESDTFAEALATTLTGFGALPFLTLAAIDGPALGAGTQLACACDLRVATAPSRIGIPAARLGLAVDRWTVQRMNAQFGASIARGMLLAAQTWNAEQLHESGFIHRIGDLKHALTFADELAALAPLTITAHKLMLEDAPGDVSEAARRAAWASNDAIEGRESFLAKRPAHFTGT
jgi:enoyl-CoA hydratase